MERNFEVFNQAVGLIFNQLLSRFPIAVELDLDEIAAKLEIEVTPYSPPEFVITSRTKAYGNILPEVGMEEFVAEATAFLAAEGFLQLPDRYKVRLSAKALTLLNAPLPGLEKPASEQIIDASKRLGTEAGRAALGEVVGQVIGAAARGIFGSA